ncbi:MAG: RRXRR domain-containing protein [Microcoleus sp.]
MGRHPSRQPLRRNYPSLYPHTLKIDSGSKFTGMALVTNQGSVIWAMELQHRVQQIKDTLEHRSRVQTTLPDRQVWLSY